MCPADLFRIGAVFAQIDRIRAGIETAALEKVYMRVGKAGCEVLAGTVDNGCALRQFELYVFVHGGDLTLLYKYCITRQEFFLFYVDDGAVFDEELGGRNLGQEE